jgi:DnaJ-class molecular chaperone
MSWDEGLMGSCPHCGLHVHAMYEDRSSTNPVWTYCATCADAGVIAVAHSGVNDFWKQPRPCRRCAGKLVEWDTDTCPRCKNAVKWTYILAAG